MESQNVRCHATCCFCSRSLSRLTEGETGCQIQLLICSYCGAVFGPPWPEHQWTEPSSEPTDLYALRFPVEPAA